MGKVDFSLEKVDLFSEKFHFFSGVPEKHDFAWAPEGFFGSSHFPGIPDSRLFSGVGNYREFPFPSSRPFHTGHNPTRLSINNYLCPGGVASKGLMPTNFERPHVVS